MAYLTFCSNLNYNVLWNAWFTVSSKGKQNLIGTKCITGRYCKKNNPKPTQNQHKHSTLGREEQVTLWQKNWVTASNKLHFLVCWHALLKPLVKSLTCRVDPFIICCIWLPLTAQVGAYLYVSAACLHPSHFTGKFAKLILWVIFGCYPPSFEMAIAPLVFWTRP